MTGGFHKIKNTLYASLILWKAQAIMFEELYESYGLIELSICVCVCVVILDTLYTIFQPL